MKKKTKITILTIFWKDNVRDYLLRYVLSVKKAIKYSDNFEIKVVLFDNSPNPTLSDFLKVDGILLNNKTFKIYEGNGKGYFAPDNNMIARLAYKLYKPDYFLFLNPDTEIDKRFLLEAFKLFNNDVKVGCVDGRQWPFEHPKQYNKNKETSYCSGACMFTKAKLFFKLGGFDEDFFMYAEDVDYSWRVWESGYKCLYEPKAICVHHCYGFSKGSLFRQYWGIRNGYLMSYLHGNRVDCLRYIKLTWKVILRSLKNTAFAESLNILKALISGMLSSLMKKKRAVLYKRPSFAGFNGLDYSKRRVL